MTQAVQPLHKLPSTETIMLSLCGINPTAPATTYGQTDTRQAPTPGALLNFWKLMMPVPQIAHKSPSTQTITLWQYGVNSTVQSLVCTLTATPQAPTPGAPQSLLKLIT